MAEEKLGALLREMYQIEKDLSDIQAVAAQNQGRLRRRLSGWLDLDAVQDHLKFQKALDRDATKIEGNLAEKAREVGQAQKEVVYRNQEMKALKRLKEKQLSDYKTLYWWEDGKRMDQIGAIYFAKDEVRR